MAPSHTHGSSDRARGPAGDFVVAISWPQDGTGPTTGTTTTTADRAIDLRVLLDDPCPGPESLSMVC